MQEINLDNENQDHSSETSISNEIPFSKVCDNFRIEHKAIIKLITSLKDKLNLLTVKQVENGNETLRFLRKPTMINNNIITLSTFPYPTDNTVSSFVYPTAPYSTYDQLSKEQISKRNHISTTFVYPTAEGFSKHQSHNNRTTNITNSV